MEHLENFLNRYQLQLEDLLEGYDIPITEIIYSQVIQYPDEVVYAISKEIKEDVSVVLFELLYLENAGAVRRVASDYGLIQAFDSQVTYIFIPKNYRKEQTKLMTDILIEKDIFELDLGPYVKHNVVGQDIYRAFLATTERGSQYERISDLLKKYFVLVHDDSGTILCHQDFKKRLW